MRCAIIYRPQNPPPPEIMPELMQRMGGWLNEYGGRLEFTEFFVGGGGFGVLDVDDSIELHRIIAAHPFTPYADVEIRPVVEPGAAMQVLQEVFAQAPAS
jgi:hypothetical protein